MLVLLVLLLLQGKVMVEHMAQVEMLVLALVVAVVVWPLVLVEVVLEDLVLSSFDMQ
tara:strand:+ start:313 stop:483 length:171 start_codon:yes stop_codon:yes gene_type:complete